MNITTEEKLMYDVMKSIYESGIPINFKGSMVLKACLLELGYTEQTRHTVDIDANVNKPLFNDVYIQVKVFTKDILPRQRDRDCER